jgi:hypothetical protein
MRRELHGLNDADGFAARVHARMAREDRGTPDILDLSARIRRLLLRADRRRPPEAGVPAMAVSPTRPKPLVGGAAAALEFDD